MTVDSYDRDGKPLSEQWWRDNAPGDWYSTSKRVGSTDVGDARVSTVWLTIDHRYPGMPRPVIFETLIFGGDWDGEMTRYSSEEQALRGHLAVLDALRAGKPPFDHIDERD